MIALFISGVLRVQLPVCKVKLRMRRTHFLPQLAVHCSTNAQVPSVPSLSLSLLLHRSACGTRFLVRSNRRVFPSFRSVRIGCSGWAHALSAILRLSPFRSFSFYFRLFDCFNFDRIQQIAFFVLHHIFLVVDWFQFLIFFSFSSLHDFIGKFCR